MYTRAHFNIMGAIGIMAICLAAVSPAGVWAAEPSKQDKKGKKPAQSQKSGAAKSGAIKASGASEVAKMQACFGDAPKIEKVSPDEGKVGDKVTITGKSFGAVECLRTVSFGPGHPAKFEPKNETTIVTTVPSGGRKGLALLTVTTASGEDSKPFLMK